VTYRNATQVVALYGLVNGARISLALENGFNITEEIPDENDPPTTPPVQSDSHSASAGVIAGSTVGAVGAVAIIGALSYFLWARSRRSRLQRTTSPFNPNNMTAPMNCSGDQSVLGWHNKAGGSRQSGTPRPDSATRPLQYYQQEHVVLAPDNPSILDQITQLLFHHANPPPAYPTSRAGRSVRDLNE
jgi:hypothetical protein